MNGWKRLAARELVEAARCLKAAAVAPIEAPRAKNGWPLNGWTRASLLSEADACFVRARSCIDRHRRSVAA